MKKMIMILTFLTTLVIGSFESKAENNILKSGKVIEIEYSENYESEKLFESLDKIFIEINNNVYIYYDIREDLEINDNILAIIDSDRNLILDFIYYDPDSETLDKRIQGSCIGEVKEIYSNDSGTLIEFSDNSGYYIEK